MASPFNNPFRLAQSPFEMPTGYGTPGYGDGLPQNQPAPEPFQWGANGARLTPDDIASKRQLAQALMKSNYSPVGSVWEGLGRVVDNVSGALDSRALDKEAKAGAVGRQALAQAILGGDHTAIAAGVQSGDPGVQKLALDAYTVANPKPRTPFEYESMLSSAGYTPGTSEYQAQTRALLDRKGDPFITAQTPLGFYNGPQSQLGVTLQGGGGQTTPNEPAWLSQFTPQEIQQMQGLAASRQGAANVPAGSPLSGALNTKTIGRKQFWNVGGDWYDNPEGR